MIGLDVSGIARSRQAAGLSRFKWSHLGDKPVAWTMFRNNACLFQALASLQILLAHGDVFSSA